MSRQQGTKPNGFTIIEVLIVLSIGGLIMLFVFQAIPALMRNSRNAQRKDSVAVILRAVSSHKLRNGGTMPPSCSAGSCTAAASFTQYEKLGYYDDVSGASITVCDGAYQIIPAPGPDRLKLTFPVCPVPVPSKVTSVDKVMIFNYQNCSEKIPGDPSYNPAIGTNNSSGYSDVIALYAIEGRAGTVQSKCQEL